MRRAAALENPLWRMSEVQHMAARREAAVLRAGAGPGGRLGSCGVIYTGSTSSSLDGPWGGQLHRGWGKSQVKPLPPMSVSHKCDTNRQFPSSPLPCALCCLPDKLISVNESRVVVPTAVSRLID